MRPLLGMLRSKARPPLTQACHFKSHSSKLSLRLIPAPSITQRLTSLRPIATTTASAANMSSSGAPPATKQNQINLLRGWPSPDLLPAGLLSAACQRILADPVESVPILQYAPDPGYQPLRERLAQWLGQHYGVEPDANRICITGGASQNLACILQSFTDPHYTRAVWMVAPCYHLSFGIFEDSGFAGRLRAAPEDDEGLDVEELERRLVAWESAEKLKSNQEVSTKSLLPPYEYLSLPCVFDPVCHRKFAAVELKLFSSFQFLLLSLSHSRILARIESSIGTSSTLCRRAPIHRGRRCQSTDARVLLNWLASTTLLWSATTSMNSYSGHSWGLLLLNGRQK